MKRALGKTNHLAVAAVIAALAIGVSSCSLITAEDPKPPGDVGTVELALQLPGTSVNSFAYSITGPHSYTGSIDVSHSSTVSSVIGNVLAGTGYSLTLTGTATDGTNCVGASSPFAVIAGGSTTVNVMIDCRVPARTGSVLVNGTINICPSIDSVSSDPPTGATIAISSLAHDIDAAPQALSYSWTTSSGTLSSATVRNPTLTCTAPGNVSLTLTVSDGDAPCNATFNLTVTCPPDSALGESAWVEIG